MTLNTLQDPINLETLLNLNCNGLYALVNDIDRKADIRYSCNLLRAIAALVESIKGNSVVPLELAKDASKLKLVILEKNVANLGLSHAKYMDQYRKQGYSLYRTKPGAKFKVQVDIDYVKEIHYTQYYFVVRLIYGAKTKIVGVFDNIEELQDFMRQHYSAGAIDEVFANNNLTAMFLEKHKK